MSQAYNGLPKQPRRSARQRNRPVLVTNTEQESTEASSEQAVAVAPPLEKLGTTETLSTVPAPVKKSRLPTFFSTIGQSAEGSKEKEADIAQARLARATRSKGQSGKVSAVQEAKPAAKTTTATRPVPQRSASGFKMRHIIGIVLYLLFANVAGGGEAYIMQALHIDRVLTQFNLFGSKVTITTSTAVFLATLLILLLVLAKFDLIPRSLAPAPAKSNATPTRTNNAPVMREPQLTVRQGVKGSADKLYEEYRLKQRKRR